MHLQLAGRFRRTRTPPGQTPLDEAKRAGAQQNHQHHHRTSASASRAFHHTSTYSVRRSLISTSASPAAIMSIARGKADIRRLLRRTLEVFPHVIQIIWGGGPRDS